MKLLDFLLQLFFERLFMTVELTELVLEVIDQKLPLNNHFPILINLGFALLKPFPEFDQKIHGLLLV